MNHIDSDTILKFILETLDPADESAVRGHLSECEACRGECEKVQSDVERFSTIPVQVEEVEPPRLPLKRPLLVMASRAAALLAAGFLAGYMSAELSSPVRPRGIQQHLIPSHASVPPSGYFSCEAVDVDRSRPFRFRAP